MYLNCVLPMLLLIARHHKLLKHLHTLWSWNLVPIYTQDCHLMVQFISYSVHWPRLSVDAEVPGPSDTQGISSARTSLNAIVWETDQAICCRCTNGAVLGAWIHSNWHQSKLLAMWKWYVISLYQLWSYVVRTWLNIISIHIKIPLLTTFCRCLIFLCVMCMSCFTNYPCTCIFDRA